MKQHYVSILPSSMPTKYIFLYPWHILWCHVGISSSLSMPCSITCDMPYCGGFLGIQKIRRLWMLFLWLQSMVKDYIIDDVWTVTSLSNKPIRKSITISYKGNLTWWVYAFVTYNFLTAKQLTQENVIGISSSWFRPMTRMITVIPYKDFQKISSDSLTR